MSQAPLLSLERFGVAFGRQPILVDVTLSLPRRGLACLLGPAASGKSTLLRTLAGLNDMHPSLLVWGSATFSGEPMHIPRPEPSGAVRPGIGLVMQHARFFLASVRENLVSALPRRSSLEPLAQTRIVTALLEKNGLHELVPRLEEDVASLPTSLQRRLAVVRALVPDPALLLADEPTAELPPQDAADLLSLFLRQAEERAVLVVTHDQAWAKAAQGTTIFLADGRVQMVAHAKRFFDAPADDAVEHFLRTGGYLAPAADEQGERPATDIVGALSTAVTRVPSASEGPRGFFWLLPGKLGGLPRPGIVESVEHDLDGLRRLGIGTLVTLEETLTVDALAMERTGLKSLHCPVTDMGVPTLDQASGLCAKVEALNAQGQSVAMHCRAGLGRTGTLLAAQLVFGGASACSAIERVRWLNPKCIQSTAQVEFLSSFEAFLRGRGVTAPKAASAGSAVVNQPYPQWSSTKHGT